MRRSIGLILLSLSLLNACDRGNSCESEAPKITLTEKAKKKYNVPEIVKYQFDGTPALSALRESYLDIPVPGFLAKELLLNPLKSRGHFFQKPQLLEWSSEGDFFIEPNPSEVEYEQIVSNPHSAKFNPEGFGLIGWAVHPELLEDSVFKNKEVRKNPDQLKQTIQSHMVIEQNSEDLQKEEHILAANVLAKKSFRDFSSEKSEYLVSMLDLNPSHVGFLKKSYQMTLSHLKEVYNVDPKRDFIRIYFHFPYAAATATLHLHIRVNQFAHPLEKAKSFDLTSLIEKLEQGMSVYEIILERQKEYGGAIYANSGAEQSLMGISGIEISKVENPFIVYE